MIQINNAVANVNATGVSNTAQLKANQDATQQEEVKAQQTAATTAVASTEKTDAGTTAGSEIEISAAYSVEISEEGARLAATASSNSATASSTDNTAATASVGGKTKTAPAPTGVQATNSANDSADSSDSSTTNLSQYSDAQLKEMVSNGKITQAEYSAEMASRKQEELQEQGGKNAKAAGSAVDTAQ